MRFAILMMNRMGMQHPFDVIAFWVVLNLYSTMEKDVMDKEISNSIHRDPNPNK